MAQHLVEPERATKLLARLCSNRLELGMPVVDAINNNFENLINNVPEAYRKDAAALPVATDFNLVGVDVRVPGSKPFAQVGNLPCYAITSGYNTVTAWTRASCEIRSTPL